MSGVDTEMGRLGVWGWEGQERIYKHSGDPNIDANLCTHGNHLWLDMDQPRLFHFLSSRLQIPKTNYTAQ